MQSFKKYSFYFIILVYVSGTLGFLLKPSFFSPFTPYTLLLTSAVFLLHQNSKQLIFYFLLIALIGFITEVLGVATTYVFGYYKYGNALGFKFLNVPLVIAFNWALLVSCASIVSDKLTNKLGFKAIIAATITTAIDFLIEQVAARLDFWYFTNNIAGWHNYIAWFVITFCCVWFFNKRLKSSSYKIAFSLLFLQVLFFGALFLFK